MSEDGRAANRKSRVLLIDDDAAVRAAHQRALENADFDVRVAQSAFEGLEMARDWYPDIILLDLLMPTVTGFEGAKVFKRKESTRDAVLVAFSGMISENELERFRRIGFDEVIAKPVVAHDLVRRIDEFLVRRKRAS